MYHRLCWYRVIKPWWSRQWTLFFVGRGMIILNALCGASASLLIRGLGKRVDVFVGTGYSLAIGGTLLVLPGIF